MAIGRGATWTRARQLPPRSRVRRACATAVEPPSSSDLSGDGGVIKRTLLPGNATAARPPNNAVVVVHFIAWLANGTQLATTRGGTPLELRLGCEPSEAVAGWELALPTMRPGERTLVTCESAYAYGDEGVPPLIPPKAAVSFELELLSWRPSVSSGGVATGISRRWIDKMVSLQDEGISMPTTSANEMLRQMVREEDSDATPADLREKGCAAAPSSPAEAPTPDEPDIDSAEVLARAAQLRDLRERAERLKRKSGDARGEEERELEVVGGGLVGEPIVQELYRKEPGAAELHSWVEGRGDIEVLIPIDEGVAARAVDVSIRRQHLRVTAPGLELEGALAAEVDVEASSWVVQPATAASPRAVYVLLVKRDPAAGRWLAVFSRDRPTASEGLGDIASTLPPAVEPIGRGGNHTADDSPTAHSSDEPIVYDVPRSDT